MTPAKPENDGGTVAPETAQRVDRWLWFARAVKSRTMAAGLVTAGKVRLNRQKLEKPSQTVRPGDVLTITIGPRVRILEVVAPGVRRGPSPEAQTLYRDLSPPPPAREVSGLAEPQAKRTQGEGRPTKRERRATDRLRDTSFDDPD
jgi:ribosome-associated heat shock protein Hsp15